VLDAFGRFARTRRTLQERFECDADDGRRPRRRDVRRSVRPSVAGKRTVI
jgi:hypothetical protein